MHAARRRAGPPLAKTGRRPRRQGGAPAPCAGLDEVGKVLPRHDPERRCRAVGDLPVSATVRFMPSGLDTPQGAAELAESLLPPLGNRWLHTQAVAARAREASAAVPEGDRDLLVAAAWLHDIGYAPELRLTGFHPLDGARHLETLGHPIGSCDSLLITPALCMRLNSAGSVVSWPCTSGRTLPSWTP
ncbi:HD domain-containing protein [Streptomyces sp. NPDC127197]|uniref:HD domain-containing protein n=1 Tax=Streptomyces sp. NPDC127197 TaxID=3345388 RepID=UPI00363B51D1